MVIVKLFWVSCRVMVWFRFWFELVMRVMWVGVGEILLWVMIFFLGGEV